MTQIDQVSPWLQFLGFPILTALTVLLGQFLIQPRIAARGHFARAKWDVRRDLYVRALKLVNQKFASLTSWSGTDVPTEANSAIAGPAPSQEDVNQVYAELALCSSRAILRHFVACFGINGRTISASNRLELARAMRADLDFGPSDLEDEDVLFFVKP